MAQGGIVVGKPGVFAASRRQLSPSLEGIMAISGPFRDKMMGGLVAIRVGLPKPARGIIGDFLFESCMEVNIENLHYEMDGLLQEFISAFVGFDSPKAAEYEGQRYNIEARQLSEGAAIHADPHVPPTVFPDDARKVTYVYKREVRLHRDDPVKIAIAKHAERYGRGSVIFKGRTLCLARGSNNINERYDRGPNITSLDRAERCALRLPVVGSWLLQAPFSLQELHDGVWMLIPVKRTGFRKVTRVYIYKGFSHDGIVYLEVNWTHHGGPQA